MIKKIRQFFKVYRQFGLVILTVAIAAILAITGNITAANWLLGITAILNTIPLLWGMWQDFRSGSYGLDLLAITSIVTAVLLKEYWAAIIVVLMLTGGQALEDYAERRAKKELTSLLEHKPKTAHVIRKGKILVINVHKIVIGDKVIVSPGEVVPIDGEIIEGVSTFDESDLTGESLPISKQVGDLILSGAVNMEGAVTVRATLAAKDSQYEQIIKLVQSAAASKAPFVRLADRYSIPFTVLAFMIAGATWAVTGDPVRFLEVIIVATPCPLLLAAPIALISGMSRAAKHGIIIKTGSALEQLAESQTIAFDKTGTLTRGVPIVSKVTAYGKFSKNEVLAYAAALEQVSVHILAKAIVNAAQEDEIKITPAKQVKEVTGMGLSGRLRGKTILVGRLSFMQELEVAMPDVVSNKPLQQTTSFVAIDGQLAGTINFEDELRPESAHMLEELKQQGIRHTLMVTGDNQATANVIAKKLGIETVLANCLPGDKIRAIEKVLNKPVAFVGDGVNDAPVLTAADVGIALGARGSTAASESADVVILLDDIAKVASSVSIAKRTFFIAKQSILGGIMISIGLMAVFTTGRYTAVQGAAIQELVDVAVIFNALRAHGSFRKR